MKVGLDGSHINDLLKGCLWMSEGISEGGQDEADQQPKRHQQHHCPELQFASKGKNRKVSLL